MGICSWESISRGNISPRLYPATEPINSTINYVKGIRDCLEMVRRFQERISRERRREGGRGERGGKEREKGEKKSGGGGAQPPR